MVTPLDLEQQEQVDALKHFWARFGKLIIVGTLIALLCVAAWMGYRYWRTQQSEQAAKTFDKLEQSIQSKDEKAVQTLLAQLKTDSPSTALAQQGAMLSAKYFYDNGKPDMARDALQWVLSKNDEYGYQSVVRMRLAGILAEEKKYDEAVALLGQGIENEFQALVDEQRGDIYLLQGKTEDAKKAYQSAYEGQKDNPEYRQVLVLKLGTVGVDPEKKSP